MRTIKKIWVSEKATDLQPANQYVFLVEGDANRNEVKKEVGLKYGVKVLAVNIIRIKGKRKKFLRTSGRKAGIKKAVVTLAPGQKIEVA